MNRDRLSAVIDFGCSGVGDPACELNMSRRVAEKIGMHLEKETRDDKGTVSVVYWMTPVDRRHMGAVQGV